MKIKLSKSAQKFLNKLSAENRNTVLKKIKFLKTSLEKQQIYPPEELDIKKLKGDFKGFSRIRVGKIRIIFQILTETEEIVIYDIDFRGNIYD
jgi:mRNA-degrading endonuclease RelE of RelBE toxin-antitoxin system